MKFDDLKVGEYFVVASPIVKLETLYNDSTGEMIILSPRFEIVTLKTMVKDYANAPAHLLAVAMRIRNYVAFSFQNAIPLNITMRGKRKGPGNLFPFPIPAAFDGSTLMPLTDAGFGVHSSFITRFGKHEGSPPPQSAFESEESFTKWCKWVNENLINSQRLLDTVKTSSQLDVALNSLGEAIWAKPYKEKLICSWRSIEAICKLDNPGIKIKPPMLLNTIRKYSDSEINDLQFREIRRYRNKSVHFNPSFEESTNIQMSASLLFKISFEITNAVVQRKSSDNSEN